MAFSHIWAYSCSWQDSCIKNKCGVPGYIFIRLLRGLEMKKSKVDTKSQTHSLIHQNRKKRNLISPSMHSVSLSNCKQWDQAEEARRGTHTAPPSKDLWVILQLSLHRGRDSEHVHPCTQACTKHGSMNPTHMNLHRWTHTHSSFIDLGIKFMPRFLDVRRSSATDTAAPVSTLLSDVWPKPALWRIVC